MEEPSEGSIQDTSNIEKSEAHESKQLKENDLLVTLEDQTEKGVATPVTFSVDQTEKENDLHTHVATVDQVEIGHDVPVAFLDKVEKVVTQTAERDDAEENEAHSENLEILKEGTVKFQGVNRILQLTSKSLKLQAATDQPVKRRKNVNGEVVEFPWQYIITAETNTKVQEDVQNMSFIIHYMQQEKRMLRSHSMSFTTVDEPADGFIKVIQQQCEKVEGRPKRLFVVVNPIGGAGRGRQIYHKKILPIFQCAKINIDVVFTERSKHALEIGETQDFSEYDGVIVVGGDGLYQEVLQGMAIQMQKSAGVDYNDVNSKFVGLNKPIGIIPAGTGNGVSGWVNGAIDIETATLRVLLGETHRSQVYTVHSNGKFFCLGGLLFGYGFFSDMIKQSDEMRWMKRARYACKIIKDGTLLWKRRIL